MDEERLGERHGEWRMMMDEEVIKYSGASQEEKLVKKNGRECEEEWRWFQ